MLDSEVLVEKPVAVVRVNASAVLSLGGDQLVFEKSFQGVCEKLVIRVYRVACTLVAREPG